MEASPKAFLPKNASLSANYLDVENPIGLPGNKHLDRLNGVGHKTGRSELHVGYSGRRADFDRANLVVLQHIQMVNPWLAKHKTIIAANYLSQRTEGEILREHNSSFAQWFKEQLTAKPPPMNSDENKLLFALSHGSAPNLMTYQAYDINGYTFYTESKDKNRDYQNSGVTMESYTGDVKLRYYGRIEEIWDLNYSGEKVPMFCVKMG
jgi:hypothetical protein